MNTDLFRATIAKYKTLRHIKTQEQIRRNYTTCGSNKTFIKWMKNPELIPYGEFENIMNGLKVPREEQLEILK